MDIIIKETPHYHKPLIPSYQGNPLIEALDPIAETQEEALGRLIIKPEFNPVELNMPVYARCHFPVRLRHFLSPTDKQAEIYYGTVLQVFEGYGHRNPLMAEGQRYVHRFKGRKEWVRIKRRRPGTISFITGLSGMGNIALHRVGAGRLGGHGGHSHQLRGHRVYRKPDRCAQKQRR